MTLDRRQFVAAAAAAGTFAAHSHESLGVSQSEVSVEPIFISTWKFGKEVNDAAMATVRGGGSLLDAIERGIWVAEADEENASVGKGGMPNADGVVQLDACIMDGRDHRAGSVAGLEEILHPISVARLVMEKTKHVMLVGSGAQEFALEHGHKKTQLLTEKRRQAWQEWQRKQANQEPVLPVSPEENHDTITLLGVKDGHVVGGCSTSGMGYKLPGRVGDSPIIGSGLYVDQQVGAAGATGIGENVMRHCAAFLIVELMRHGQSPQQACESTLHRIAAIDPRGYDLDIHFIAISATGQVGAAGTGKGFPYAVAQGDVSEIRRSPGVSAARK